MRHSNATSPHGNQIKALNDNMDLVNNKGPDAQSSQYSTWLDEIRSKKSNYPTPKVEPSTWVPHFDDIFFTSVLGWKIMSRCPQRPREDIGLPRAEVIGGCKPWQPGRKL